ncbi:hypothetical protein FUAX_35540 [Fulvitalea axinellae]|uniref:Transposase IS30-like HTH domain-containing protein n=1 Tax=Fulvitalea axinellae TaxID=1182444 RepID=A0AAU9D0B3_9BACT|nr:hypothetical protein FUAX_35540 [Fulvitalea axinellae]
MRIPADKYSHLNLNARRQISRCVNAGLTIRQTASRLGVSPSTISRELKRNSFRGFYSAIHAQAYYEARKFLAVAKYRGQLIFRLSSVGVSLFKPKTDRLITAWASDYRNARYIRNERTDNPFHAKRQRRSSIFAVWEKPVQPRLMKLRLQHYGQKTTPSGEVNPFGDPPKFWKKADRKPDRTVHKEALCA